MQNKPLEFDLEYPRFISRIELDLFHMFVFTRRKLNPRPVYVSLDKITWRVFKVSFFSATVISPVGAHEEEHVSPILGLSRVDLFMERLPWEIQHAHCCKIQSKQCVLSQRQEKCNTFRGKMLFLK